MFTKRILNGVLGGLAGGIVFGMMMGMMGMFPMIGKIIGHPTVVAGLLVHMVNSAIIGAGFGLVFGGLATRVKPGLEFGLLYGLIWWLLGPLTLMPLFLGMGLGANWNFGAMASAMPSLMGHLIYGAVLGFIYARLSRSSNPARGNLEAGYSTVKTK